MSTLKQNYKFRKLHLLNERVKLINEQMINENATAVLLIEAMDDEDLQKAGAVIDKLRSLKGKGLAYLDSSIEQAEAELNKYTGGGPIAKAWSKIKSKVGIDNPLVKIMTFANSLEMGFKQFPMILKNSIGQITPDLGEKTLNDIITDETKKTNLTNNMLKALSPKGIFGAFKIIPFIDSKQLVADLMSVKLKDLNTVVKATTSGAQSSDIATDMKDSISGQGSAETKGSAQGQETKSSSHPTGTTPAKSSTTTGGTTPVGQTPFRQDKNTEDLAKTVYKDMYSDFGDVDEKTAMSVLSALANNNKLKA